MQRQLPISIFLSLMLTVINWAIANNKASTAMQVVQTSTDSCVHVGRLLSVQGKVQLKRKVWSEYHPTTVGAVLCLGDLLQPAKGAQVIVQCTDPNQDLWTVPDGIPSGAAIGCSPPDKPVHTITGPITPTRSSSNRRIPFIISPKNTWLLKDKPTLNWQAVPGATTYTVRLTGSGVNWETEVNKTSVIYPGKPPLSSAAEGYLLTVEADNGESPAKATFGLLSQNQAQRVQLAAARIAKQNLTDEAKTLALAYLYIGQELTAEATQLLEALVAKKSKTAAVYSTLGDLYTQIELLPLAEDNYLQAFKLARTANDVEGQATAAARLAQVYTALGNSDAANQWLKAAQIRYQALGNLNP